MGGSAPTPDRVRAALDALGGRLADLESDRVVALARAGALVGESAVAWSGAEAEWLHASATHRRVTEVLGRTGAAPGPDGAPPTVAPVSGPDGAVDALTALRRAEVAVDAAAAVTARLAAAWDRFGGRVTTARTAATAAADPAATRAVDAVATQLGKDPLAVTDAEVVAAERLAEAARARWSVARVDAARLDADLTDACEAFDELVAAARAADGEIAHAAARIAGLSGTGPVPDLAELGRRLDRIRATATRDPGAAAAQLDGWRAAAEGGRADLDRLLGRARDGLRRRGDGRGLWTALRAKAATRQLDEHEDVADALDAAEEELWRAPCDLAVADAALARLAGLLENGREVDR